MAGLSGFSKYKVITISTANVDADLSNFSAYVPIVNDADIGAICRADGYDVQFSNSDNSEVLSFERLPGFSVSGGQANGDFYVRVPTIYGSSDTTIRCYYGKADATDASSPENTFRTADGWVAVWHLEEAAAPYLDATGVNNSNTAGNDPVRIEGKIKYGQDFEFDLDQDIVIPSHSSLKLGTVDFTISMWANVESVPEWCAMLGNATWGTLGWAVWVRDDPHFRFIMHDGVDKVEIFMAAGTLGQWRHVAVRCDRDVAAGLYMVLDGTQSSDNNPTAVGDMGGNTNDHAIGNWYGGTTGGEFDGKLDEVRISNIDRGLSWVKFEYYNSHDGHAAGNEISWGSEQSAGGSPQTLTPGGITSLEGFGGDKLNFTLFGSGIATEEAFGSGRMKLYLLPSAIESLEAFGTEKLNFVLLPSSITSAEAFGTQKFILYLLPSGIGTAEEFGTGKLNFILKPSGILTAEGFGTDKLNFLLFPSGVTSEEAFGSHIIQISGGLQYITPSSISSLEAFGGSKLNLRLYASAIASSEAFGQGRMLLYLRPSSIASLEAFGSAKINFKLLAQAIQSAETFGSSILYWDQFIEPAGITSGENFGVLIVTLPAGIAVELLSKVFIIKNEESQKKSELLRVSSIIDSMEFESDLNRVIERKSHLTEGE